MKTKPTYEELEKRLRQTEKQLHIVQKSERLYKALMEQSPVSIEVYSPDGFHQQVNNAWQKLFRVKPEDTLGKYNCLKDEQAVKIGSAIAFKHVLTGETIAMPDSLYDPAISGYPEGRKRWLRSNFFPIKDNDGSVQHVVIMHEDITDWVNTQEKYKWVVENSPEAILVLQDGCIKFLNQRTSKLTGYTSEGLLDKPFHDFIHPDDLDMVKDIYLRRLEGENISNLTQFRVITHTGASLWLQTTAVIIEWEGHPATLVFGADITALKDTEEKLGRYQKHLEELVAERTKEMLLANRKLTVQIGERQKIEAALIEEKNKVEAVLAAFGDALSVQNKEFIVLYQNDAHIAIKGDCKERYCYEAYQQRNSICPDCALIKCFKDGRIHKHERAIPIGGDTKYFEVTVSPIRDASGDVIAGTEVVRDITEQKKLAARLLQRHKTEAIGTLAGGIAHDFNNILTGILGYAELALLDARSRQENKNALQEIILASRRAAGLVSQILTFSRHQEPKKEVLQLQPIIKEALKLMRGTLPSTISIKQQFESDCPPVMGDINQIHQVIVNLCTNAFHAMRAEGGTLTVLLDQITLEKELANEPENVPPGRYTKICISDTGHGMDKETMARIFDPYFTRKQFGEGSGLGLATVNGIIRSHHGHIKVSSELNRGTSFTIFLPATNLIPTAAKPFIGPKTLPNVHGNVLLVDDEEMLVEVAGTILTRIGCHVTTFLDSPEALASFRTNPQKYDLVITDQTMPKLTGFELAKNILAIRPTMPVILMTGHSDAVDVDKAWKAGIIEYMMKPIDLHDFAKKVAGILSGQDEKHPAATAAKAPP